MRRVLVSVLAFVTLALSVVVSVAGAQGSEIHGWRENPAYRVTVQASSHRVVPRSVCPFGISDVDTFPRVRTVVIRGRIVYNLGKRVRVAYVFCG